MTSVVSNKVEATRHWRAEAVEISRNEQRMFVKHIGRVSQSPMKLKILKKLNYTHRGDKNPSTFNSSHSDVISSGEHALKRNAVKSVVNIKPGHAEPVQVESRGFLSELNSVLEKRNKNNTLHESQRNNKNLNKVGDKQQRILDEISREKEKYRDEAGIREAKDKQEEARVKRAQDAEDKAKKEAMTAAKLALEEKDSQAKAFYANLKFDGNGAPVPPPPPPLPTFSAPQNNLPKVVTVKISQSKNTDSIARNKSVIDELKSRLNNGKDSAILSKNERGISKRFLADIEDAKKQYKEESHASKEKLTEILENLRKVNALKEKEKEQQEMKAPKVEVKVVEHKLDDKGIPLPPPPPPPPLMPKT